MPGIVKHCDLVLDLCKKNVGHYGSLAYVTQLVSEGTRKTVLKKHSVDSKVPIITTQFIITAGQLHFPEWLEVKFTLHTRLKEGMMSIPNNSDKNVNGETGNLHSRYPQRTLLSFVSRSLKEKANYRAGMGEKKGREISKQLFHHEKEISPFTELK
jgi:hypothetical protein